MILHYDINKLTEILKSFYILTNARIVVFNNEFQKISEYPSHDCGFCSLVRSDPSAHERCLSSDRYACGLCRKRNHIYSYICHAGLTETVAPIKCRNVVIGYLMFGQVLDQSDKENYWPGVQCRCSGYNVDMEQLKAAYFQKTPVSLERIQASARLLEACAGFLWLQRYISLREDSLPNMIDEYITENLGADLSVSALCGRFNISRSRLYKIAAEYYGKGIERLTRELRINAAKELLKSTGLPVGEVSYRVGYMDYNYFIRLFKKETGNTPNRYRKQFKKVLN